MPPQASLEDIFLEDDQRSSSQQQGSQQTGKHLSYIDQLKNRLFGFLDEDSLFARKHHHDHGLLPPEQDQSTQIAQKQGMRHAVMQFLASAARMGPKSNFALLKVFQSALVDAPINDKDHLMEDMMVAVVKDNEHVVSQKMTQFFVKQLWEDLQHPPNSLLSEEFQFRKADGSGNSLLHPHIGAAGQPYARSVKPANGPPAVLPDPEVVFETLLRRRNAKPHPGGLSSMLPYLATVIVHDLFRTDHVDFTKSKTSSYLDLAPLYGSSDAELKRVRAFKDGKLKPDCFSEVRLLALPPGSGILLLMFNRFHNHVAQELAEINEHGRFDMPQKDTVSPNNPKKDTQDKVDKIYEAALAAREERLFQTARLITGGLYINIILVDYVRTILNLNRTDRNWQLDPRVKLPGGPEPGCGNQVSVEFNLVYRWHGVLSERDVKWTEAQFRRLFNGKDPDQVPMPEFLRTLGHLEMATQRQDPMDRQFERFVRQENGYYKDEELVKNITDSIEDAACAFGPRGVPLALKAVEVLGLQQSRSWNLASLNEFRKHFNLQTYEKFEDISSDPEVADALKRLYKDVDNVELGIGLACEDSKPPRVPSSGLCPGYSAGRAILADAVSLVRGDRFYTTSYHSRNLTNWGFGEAEWVTKVDNGCVFYKLFERAFPNQLHPDSIYAHYPLTLAKETVQAFRTRDELLRKIHKYDMSPPLQRPSRVPVLITSYTAAQSLLQDTDSARLDLELALALLLQQNRGEADYQNKVKTVEKHLVSESTLLLQSVSEQLVGNLLTELEQDLKTLISQKSYKLSDFKEVDIIAHVIRPASVRLAAKVFKIQHKTEDCSEKRLTKLFDTVAATWTNFDEPTLTALRQKRSRHVPCFKESMLPELEKLKKKLTKSSNAEDPYETYLFNAFKAGLSAEQTFAASIILAASLATNLTRTFSELLNYLLNDPAEAEDRKLLKTVRDMENGESGDKDRLLDKYIHELARLSSEAATVRVAAKDLELSGLTIANGQRILIPSRLVNKDRSAFAEPTKFDLERETQSFLPFDVTFGVKDAKWQDLHLSALRTMVRIVIAGRTGLRAGRVWDGRSKNSALKKIPVRFDRPAWKQTQQPAEQQAGEQGPGTQGIAQAPEQGAPQAVEDDKWMQQFDPEGPGSKKEGDSAPAAAATASNTDAAQEKPVAATTATQVDGSGDKNPTWGPAAASEPKHLSAAAAAAAAGPFSVEPLPCTWKPAELTAEEKDAPPAQMVYLNEGWDGFSPFPCTLMINWDENVAA